jgi:hypothetical protein
MTNPCEFIQERAMDPENPTPTRPRAHPDATPTPTPAAAPPPTAEQRPSSAESERVLGIQRIGAR